MSALTMPTVHLNGTSHQMLFDGYMAAYRAIGDAQEAIHKIEFNARDYYPQGNEAWKRATGEMLARVVKLQEVRDEFMAILEHLQTIEDNRNRR